MKMLSYFVTFSLLLLVGWVNSLTFSGMLRDQSPRPATCGGKPCTSAKGDHPSGNTYGMFPGIDFEWSMEFYDLGITKPEISSDRKPVYAWGDSFSLNKSVHSQTTFDTWFRDTPYTKNFPISIELSNANTGDSRVFCYDNSSFFPLDGIGWGNDGNAHNYHFCMEIHGRFAYKGGEIFDFFGDDDVFMYINNQRVIDIGGVHTILTAKVELDKLGLKIGTNYPFDFFFCERHTILSNMKICTSLEIYCAYYDWCGVCEGDGQSCCVGTNSCDDGDKCTIDKCSVLIPPTSECIHTPVVCNDNNICSNAACNPASGNCSSTPRVCNDGNKCTIDTCDPARGGCVYTPVDCSDAQGLCTTDICDANTGECIHTPIKCDDGDECTKDSCSPSVGCQATRITCDDNNKCTADSCDHGCQFVNTSHTCNDNNACTKDSCSPTTGCVFQSIVCDDNSKCTTDSCDTQKGCQTVPVVCDDGNPCTNDKCNPSTGCEITAVKCNDDNACTNDKCDIAAGGCVYTNSTCDDGNACTVDSCNPSLGCTTSPLTCNDNNACTADSCDTTSGCKITPVICDDKNVCTKDTCDSVKGCQSRAIPCDDLNACTEDSCDPLLGCQYKNISVKCDDGDKCTDDSCIPNVGCSYKRITCVDDDPCTNNTCVPAVGCVFPKIFADCTLCDFKICNFTGGDKCKPQQCDPSDGSCKPAPEIVCNDNSKCTTDSCDPNTGICDFKPITCNDNNNCTKDTCESTVGCVYRNVSCDDNNPCTTDSCIAPHGTCSNIPLPGQGCVSCGPDSCSYTDYCRPKVCNSATSLCQELVVSCDDNNACTNDSCVSFANGTYDCRHIPIKCTTVDLCVPMICDPVKGCIAEPVVCDDNNPCTVDTCNTTGRCVYNAKCITSNSCAPVICTNGACVDTVYPCNDGNPCTNDSCTVVAGAPTCVFTSFACSVSDPCYPASCNVSTGLCETIPVDCDDNNPCSIDSCSNVGGAANCQYADVVCTPADMCQPEVCNVTTGLCESLGPINCDDGNNCTNDSCDLGECVYVLDPCDDGNACTVDTCDNMPPNGILPGCQHSPLTFAPTNSCVTAYCDLQLGVVEEFINCTEKVNITSLCESTLCDAQVGCLKVNRTCLVRDLEGGEGGEGGEDCWMAVCNPVNGECELVSRENKHSPKCAFLYLSTAEKVAVITAPILAAIIISAIVFAAIASFAAKKAYDFLQMRHTGMGAAANNPLYQPSVGAGTNPLYS